MERVEIRKVENGFIVTPPIEIEYERRIAIKSDEIYVFNSFAALSKWLRDKFTPHP